MIESEQQNRIDRVFAGRDSDDTVMSLFLTAGYPSPKETAELILGLERNGADMIELGMPFSDPLADGPTIQYSSTQAIRAGITMQKIFDIVQRVRRESHIPIILMGYINPILRFGVKAFCQRAATAGVDGLIIPDVPPEETKIIEEPAHAEGLSIIYLIAPNTSDERMQKIDARSEGFVYCVSVTGVTGAREGNEVAESVKTFIGRVEKNITRNPKLVGFGIKSHDDAKRVSAGLDGFIVGSALISNIRDHYPAEGWREEVFAFVKSLKYG